MQQKVTSRSREQVARFFAGLDLVAPGLVRVGEWRQDPHPACSPAGWCAVGRKRGHSARVRG
jgi:S-adenosyl methyltransferase